LGLCVVLGLFVILVMVFVYVVEDVFCWLLVYWMWWFVIGGVVIGVGGLVVL